MAVFEVTDRTILKMLVRRGLDSERQQVRFDEGELAYTIDTKRMFVGDGLGGGGNVVGNVYQGAFPDVNVVLNSVPGLQYGDLFYDTTESTLFAINDENATEIFDLGPRYEEAVLVKNQTNGVVRISEAALGKFFSTTAMEDRRKAFYFDYNVAEPFAGTFKVLEFNSQYWAITSRSSFDPNVTDDATFYLGDIKTISYPNPKLNQNYKLNINASNGWTGGLIIYGTGDNVFSIGADGGIGNSQGQTDIIALSGIGFHPAIGSNVPSGQGSVFISSSGSVFFNETGGTFTNPRFVANGFSKFLDSVAINNNLTVYGNITALGDFSVLDTVLTVSSALSVINYDNNRTLTVLQNNAVADTAVFRNGNIPVQSITFDEFCNAKFGTFYGRLNRDSSAVYTDPIASVDVRGSLYVRDPNTNGASGGNGTGYFDVSVTGEANIVSNANFIDGGTRGNYMSKGGLPGTVPAASRPNDTVLFVEASDPGSAASYLGVSIQSDFGTASRPALQIKTTAAGNINHKLISVQNSAGSDLFTVTSNPLGTVQVTGELRVTGDVIAFYSSDIKLKKNINVIDDALSKVNNIRGITFEWNDEARGLGKESGLIAQELEAVLPEVVITREDGTKAVRYDKVIPLLVEAVKELHKLIKVK